MADQPDLTTKATTKAFRQILRGALACNAMMRHIDNSMGINRHNESVTFMANWWGMILGRGEGSKIFATEVGKAMALVNEVGGSMKEVNGIWVVDHNKSKVEENRIVTLN